MINNRNMNIVISTYKYTANIANLNIVGAITLDTGSKVGVDSNAASVGCLIAIAANITIQNVTTNMTVATISSGIHVAGGLVGTILENTTVQITNATYNGSVTGSSGTTMIGGIVGSM